MTAQEHADVVRGIVLKTLRYTDGVFFTHEDYDSALAALDALLKEVERLTAERDEARKWHALHVSELEHRYLRERGRAEAAERERDNAKDALERMRQELVRVDGLNRAAEALAERREAERDDLLHAFQEIWDDWCSGHMGDCSCIVCSLVSDALSIDRENLAGGNS